MWMILWAENDISCGRVRRFLYVPLPDFRSALRGDVLHFVSDVLPYVA
jgi:hypothetical protein